MPVLQTYSGGCHCGRVRYEVETDLTPVVSCNCSICQKRGALWTYVPAERFTLVSGTAELSDYQFNKRVIHHLFCRNCGTASFARGMRSDGSEGISINIRCLDDIDLNALTPTEFDGRSL